MDIYQQYIDQIVSDVKLSRPMKITVGCSNGVAGAFMPELFRAMGCEVTELPCKVDGHFPNHHPDSAHVESPQDLVRMPWTTDCEPGLVSDDDGDRLGVVAKDGRVVFLDRRLTLFAQEVLSRSPGGEIISDVKCAGKLALFICKHDGKTTVWKTGHSLAKARLKGTGVPLADEMGGHIFFKNCWYSFGDGPYTGARLLEIVPRLADPSATLNALLNSHYMPELQLKRTEGESFGLPDRTEINVMFAGVKEVDRIDDVRVEYEDGFGLARSSNTAPVVVMCPETDNDATMTRIQGEFRRMILAEKPGA